MPIVFVHGVNVQLDGTGGDSLSEANVAFLLAAIPTSRDTPIRAK